MAVQLTQLVLQFSGGAILLALAGAVAIRWLRDRYPIDGWLALAAGLLALGGLLTAMEEAPVPQALTALTVLVWVCSGLALVAARDSVLPMRKRTRAVVAGLALAAVVLPLTTGLDLGVDGPLTTAQAIAGLVLMGVWTGFVAEPTVRFWRASRQRATVQRSRLKSLSIGYGGLLAAVLVVVVLESSGLVGDQSLAGALLTAVAFLMIGALYAAFVPPRWLRRLWHDREERDLLRNSPPLFLATDRDELASRAVDRAVRLAGADGGFLVGPGGDTVAVIGVTPEQVSEVVSEVGPVEHARTMHVGPRRDHYALLPLNTDDGRATLGLLAGPLTPAFGAEELESLTHFSQSIAVALDHVRLNEIKNTFLSAVSHELRTPLTSVLGLALTLEQNSLPEDKRKQLLGRLAFNATRLESMLSDLLDMDRIARGVMEPRKRPVDLSDLVRRVLRQSDAPNERSVVVQAEDVLVLGDPAWLERIVENLLANAVKHTPPGAKIWVRVEKDGDHALMAVEDDGRGVSPEHRSVIFEPFRRGPDAPQHAPGTGIGLSLVTRFAELHGGRAWVEDRPGGGASFRVSLPSAG